MNACLSIWDRLTRVVGILLCLAGLLGVVVWYLPLLKQNEQMRKEIQRLEGQVQDETEKARRLKAVIEGQRDPKSVERLARERLGYAKPGETVVRFEGTGNSTNGVATVRP